MDTANAETSQVDAVYTLVDTLGCVAMSTLRGGHLGDGWNAPEGAGRAEHADAVFRNAFNAHRLELDSVSYLARGHAATVLWPVVLSTDVTRSPAARLRAYLFGYEVFAYLGAWFGTELRQRGYHATAVLGSVAGASARAHLQDASVEEMGRRMGLAALLSAGRQTAFASSMKAVQVAWAGRIAVESTSADLLTLDVPVQYWTRHLSELADVDLQQQYPFDQKLQLELAGRAEPTHFKIAAYCAYFDEALRQLARQRQRGELVSLTVPDYIAQHHRPGDGTGSDVAFDLSALAAAVWKHGLSGQVLSQAHKLRQRSDPVPQVLASRVAATVAEPAYLPALVKPPSQPMKSVTLTYGTGARGSFAEAADKFGWGPAMTEKVAAFVKDPENLFEPTLAVELVRTISEDMTR